MELGLRGRENRDKSPVFLLKYYHVGILAGYPNDAIGGFDIEEVENSGEEQIESLHMTLHDVLPG